MLKNLIYILFLFFAYPIGAQTPPPKQAAIDLAQTDKQLDTLIKQLEADKIPSQQTGEILQNLTDIQDALNQYKTDVSAELNKIQKKLDALGPATESGTEPKTIAKQRREFSNQADNYHTQISQVDLQFTKINEINNLILKIRNRKLLDNILTKQSSIFQPTEFWQSLTAFAGFTTELLKSPISWYQNLSSDKKTSVNNNILRVIISMLFALVAAGFLRRFIKRRLGYVTDIERPNYAQKVRAGIWMFVARGVIPAALIGAFLFWLQSNPLINADSFGLLLKSAALCLLYYYLTKAFIKAVFVPDNGKWRMIQISDERAKIASSTLITSSAAICFVYFFQDLAARMNYDASIIYSLKICANTVKVFCIIWVARRVLYDSKTLSDEEISSDTPIADLSVSSKLSLGITFVALAAFMPSLFGYIRLSEYIINRAILSVVVIGLFYIIDNLLRWLIHQILLFRFWVGVFRINRRTLVKTEFWLGLLLTPIIWICGGLTLLALWGIPVDLLLARAKNFLVGFNVGGVHISLTSIGLGILTFIILLSFFKLLKNSFISGNLSKIEMNSGLRNSVTSSIGFLGVIISVLLSIAVMGVNLSNIALIAGALSFGVGLGLQNIVSNLAAGLIILWDRPLKIGDLVIINGQEGVVRRINMRSTELVTIDKSTIIIPNSDILSKSLTNYTYLGNSGRLTLKLTVKQPVDTSRFKQAVSQLVLETPAIISTPAPEIITTNIGAATVDFSLSCFTDNIFERTKIADNLRERLLKQFSAEPETGKTPTVEITAIS